MQKRLSSSTSCLRGDDCRACDGSRRSSRTWLASLQQEAPEASRSPAWNTMATTAASGASTSPMYALSAQPVHRIGLCMHCRPLHGPVDEYRTVVDRTGILHGLLRRAAHCTSHSSTTTPRAGGS